MALIGSDGIILGKKKDGTPYKVFIIDDSQFIIKQLSQILMAREFEIIDSATNGKEAIEKFQSIHNDVDLVTLDITMPEMDGITALKELKKIDPNVKVVMVTALGTADAVKQAIMNGAKGYIVKPLDREKVLERLGQILVD